MHLNFLKSLPHDSYGINRQQECVELIFKKANSNFY